MERSTTNKDVNNYEVLATYYDYLLQDEEAYDYWLKYIEEESFKDVLELASGSAVLTKILANKGYNITASDISKEMKQAARANFVGEYLILNMTDYHLNKKYDLILCCCDSINYLELEELDNFINCAYEHLNDNGRLIFDMHSMKRIEEFKDEYIEEGEVCGVNYQWTIMSDDIDNLINEHFTFYTDDGMISEHHTQHVFEIEDVKEKMNTFFDTRVIEDFVEDEKVLVIGKKHEKMV